MNPFFTMKLPKSSRDCWDKWELNTRDSVICCAIREYSGFPKYSEEECLEALEFVQEDFRTSDNNLAMFALSERSQRSMINLVEAMPGIECVARVKSIHGPYFNRVYFIRKD